MKITNRIENRVCTLRELKPTDVFSLDGEIYMVMSYCSKDECGIVSLETGYHIYRHPDTTVYKLDAELILS